MYKHLYHHPYLVVDFNTYFDIFHVIDFLTFVDIIVHEHVFLHCYDYIIFNLCVNGHVYIHIHIVVIVNFQGMR